MSHEIKYRTFDQLLEDVTVDLSTYSLEGMIEPQQLIKVAMRVNFDLGLRVQPERHEVIEIEHGKAKLPSNFYSLNYANICGTYRVEYDAPSGSHIEDVIIAPDPDCVPADPTTNTTTTTTTEEVTTGGTPAVTQEIVVPGTPGTLQGYGAFVPTNNLSYTSTIAHTFYNPLTGDFVLTLPYNNPFGLQTYDAETGAMKQQYTNLDVSYGWTGFIYFPGHEAFIAYNSSLTGAIALFDANTYQKISSVSLTGGAWSFVYDPDNECVWGIAENNGALNKITIVGTGASRSINRVATVYSSGLAAPSNKGLHLDSANQKLYVMAHDTGGSVGAGWLSNLTEFTIDQNGTAVFAMNYNNSNWVDAGTIGTYKPRFGRRNTVLDTVNNRMWIRASDTMPVSAASYTKLFYIDISANDGIWHHYADLVPEGLDTGTMVLNPIDGNIIYTDSEQLNVIDPSDLSAGVIVSLTVPISYSGPITYISFDEDGDLFLGAVQFASSGNLGYFSKSTYSGATEPTTQTVVVTPAVPGTTTSTTTTTTVDNTSSIDALYQCQPEGTCINQCGEYYQLVQKVKTEVRIYETFLPLKVKANQSVSGCCPNVNYRTPNEIEIRDGFVYSSFSSGKIYINYQSAMEDVDGTLLVMDHPLVNEYYEYAIKQRIFENLFFTGEPVTNQMQLVEQRLRASRNNALSFVNTPNFKELQKIWEMNRRSMYDKYVNMFKSTPTVR